MAKRPTQKNSSSVDPARDPATVTARMEERIRRLEQERDAALDRLRQAERAGWTLEALMDYIPEGITIADAPDVRIRLVSRYGQELTGRPEEFTNSGVSEPADGWGIFRPDGTLANNEELPLTRAILSGEVVRNEEWLLRRPDGREIIVLCNAGPIRNSDGRITGGVVAWRDINQLRLTMRTLKTVTEYRLALDSARLGTWEYDYVSARFFLGERCRSFFGTMEQGIEYGRFLALFHPEDRPDLERAIRQAAATDLDGHFTTELRVARPDGSTSWLLIHAQAVFAGIDQSQRVVRLIGTVMDITDRKEAEQALREREERFRGTFENAAVGIAHVALDGHILRMNQRFCDMLGYTQVEMVEKRFQDLTHPEDLADDVADAERLRSGAIAHYSMEKRYLNREGLTVWMNMTRSLQRNDKGEPLYFITVIEDISSRKEAEAALKESQERLSLALNALRGGVWHRRMDPESPFEISDHIYISPQLKEVIGYGAEEIPDSVSAWHDRIHPEDRPLVQRAARQYATGETPDYQVEYRVRHRNGSWLWLLSLGRMLRDIKGRPERWAGVDLDVTERKNMEQELRHAIHRCGQDSRAKDEFMANISHELRTPMTIIMTSLQLLQQDDLRQRNYLLEVSDAAANQLLAIIDDLLDFSLLETQEMEIARKPFNVRSCVQKAVNSIADIAGIKGLSLAVEIAPEVPEAAVGDPDRLEQALRNLMDNAVKFTETGGIDVQVGIDGQTLLFSVRDTGIGIPEEKMELIFHKFTQADTSSTRKHGGTGMGLAISKGLVELMGGEIRAENRQGTGSVFSFRLPLEVPPDE